MNIVTEFNGNQKKFHWYWLPLIYKHQECTFYIKGEFVFPRDVSNIKVNAEPPKGGPTLTIPMDQVPTYRAMLELASLPEDWKGNHIDLGQRFYEV